MERRRGGSDALNAEMGERAAAAALSEAMLTIAMRPTHDVFGSSHAAQPVNRHSFSQERADRGVS
jgi:hypothetical protein